MPHDRRPANLECTRPGNQGRAINIPAKAETWRSFLAEVPLGMIEVLVYIALRWEKDQIYRPQAL